MKKAVFTFHGSLNDFLRLAERSSQIKCCFQGSQSVKHLIESLHVPHPEVGEIIANGKNVDLNYIAGDGDTFSVFPLLPDAATAAENLKFVLDNHLGKLAAYLRILGFDSAYRNDFQDEELALISSQENRILLTRDRGLLMRKIVEKGYCLRSLDPVLQLDEIVLRYHLAEFISPFKRCVHCNFPLQPVEKSMIVDRLEPLTRKYFDTFHLCPNCGQIYWQGSHYEHMLQFINNRYRYH